tara:strand:+ start:13540 stop:17139 length:3600 start_codon:yes stop_codon:yes gene_type:complete
MTAIKDILKLDLQEDIKNVIDLEDVSKDEIQAEIESYIITDGLGKHLSKFITQYTSSIKETGVWLSGFYGSGKSYFGKMLGYLIANPDINGTKARDRFLPRLTGVANQSLIENDIRKLDSIRSKVIFLDIAKQNTDNGLAFTLFANFLKNIGFRDDVLGYYSFHLMLKDKYDAFQADATELLGEDWNLDEENYIEAIFKVNAEKYGKSEEITSQVINTYNNNIENFSSSKFKEELEKYLTKFPDENLVFVFDEASEALAQKKFSLLDLEGIAESLSSISSKVWTIAIAQEKLDDVINNANVNKSQLTKVTDRFKTKLHLESTEVDVIIRNRLLLKREEAFNDLVAYYKKHEGQVSDSTNLKATFPTKTHSAEQFATYYPFHKYQFDLLQKFLFSSNALVATQIAARGMIITTFDVLRKEMRNRKLFEFTTAHDLCTEAQTAPPADLANKYSNAKSILDHNGIDINGELLLKTLHFINESELTSANAENITKSYITDISTYYEVKPKVEKALGLLVESKILLSSNNNYKITSNLEGKLLEEMKDFDVELFVKKRELVGYLKKLSIFRQVAVINEDSVPYNFNILTDLDDEIIPSNNKNLRITTYSLFNINEERQDFVEGIKMDTQYQKDLITLIPDNSKFHEIDTLLEEVKRYGYMDGKYGSDDDASIRQIIREFSTIKEEKEKDLVNLIGEAYANGSLIYLFDENLLNKDSFKVTTNEVQKKLIKNIYTKRLTKQLSEDAGRRVINESNDEKLHHFFSGDEFKFFDKKGNFTGDHLKVVEEINAKISTRYIDGKSLEEELSIAPWGFSYGTISTTLAALFRAGKLVVKFNDTDYFSHTDKAAHDAFISSTKFRSARFKSITKTLDATQKNSLIQCLIDLNYEEATGTKIGWNVSDFDAADGVTKLAEIFVTTANTLKNTQLDFDKLFPQVIGYRETLQAYSFKTTEANYLQKAEDFLNEKENFTNAVKNIVKVEKFIKKNLDKLKGFKRFVTSVEDELVKAGISNEIIKTNTESFRTAMNNDVIENFKDIQHSAQSIKDAYYELMVGSAAEIKAAYSQIKENTEKALEELKGGYPADLNVANRLKLEKLINYCSPKIIDGVRLEYHIDCQDSKFSLSDMMNYADLAPTKAAELEMIKGGFVKETLPSPEPGSPKLPKKMKLGIEQKVMTAGQYRKILAAQIQGMAGMPDDDEVEVSLNN